MTSQCGLRRPNLYEIKMRRRYDVACRVGSFFESGLKKLTQRNIFILEMVFDSRSSFSLRKFGWGKNAITFGNRQ